MNSQLALFDPGYPQGACANPPGSAANPPAISTEPIRAAYPDQGSRVMCGERTIGTAFKNWQGWFAAIWHSDGRPATVQPAQSESEAISCISAAALQE